MLAYDPLPLRPRCRAAQQAPAPAPAAPAAAAAAASASPAELELPYDAWRLVLDGEVVCAPLPAALLRGYAAKLKVSPEGRSTKFSLDDLSVAGIPPAAYPHKCGACLSQRAGLLVVQALCSRECLSRTGLSASPVQRSLAGAEAGPKQCTVCLILPAPCTVRLLQVRHKGPHRVDDGQAAAQGHQVWHLIPGGNLNTGGRRPDAPQAGPGSGLPGRPPVGWRQAARARCARPLAAAGAHWGGSWVPVEP